MKFMHRNVYQVARLSKCQALSPSHPIILTRNMTISQRSAAKLHHFVRKAKETDAKHITERKRTLAPERCEGSYLKRYIYLRLRARGARALAALAAEAAPNLRVSARRRRDARRTRQQDEPECRVAPARILPAQRYTRPFRARGTSALWRNR